MKENVKLKRGDFDINGDSGISTDIAIART